MKKRWICAIATSLFLIGLLATGCGVLPSTTPPTSTTPEPATSSPTQTTAPTPPQTPPIIAKLSLLDSPAYEGLGLGPAGERLQYAYIIALNTTNNYLSPMFTIRQYDENGNYLQEVSRQGSYIPPHTVWATDLFKMTKQQLQQWRIVDIKTQTVSTTEGQRYCGHGSIGLNNITMQTITNINGIPILYLIGELSNSDPPYRSTPRSISIQVFNDLTGKGDYALAGYIDNVSPIPPPGEKVKFQMALKSKVSIVGSYSILGMISIKAYYPK